MTIVAEEELANHMGKSLSSLEGIVSAATMEKLRSYEQNHTYPEFYLPVIDYLFLEHHLGNKSIQSLATIVELGLGAWTLRHVFDALSLPRLTNAEAINRCIALRLGIHGDSKQQKADYGSVGGKVGGQVTYARGTGLYSLSDKERMKARSEGGKTTAELKIGAHGTNKEGVSHSSIGGQRTLELSTGMFGSEALKKRAGAIKRNWQSKEFRQRQAEGARRERLSPEGVERHHLPTIAGYRSDIRFYAQSTWEANFARALEYCGRSYEQGKIFRLEVPEELKHLFKSGVTDKRVDFAVMDPRGNKVLYEIVAHQSEGTATRAKLEMLARQHPDVRLRQVTPDFYRRLRKHFADGINGSPKLHGWETYTDNLRTSPAKYA